MSQENALRLYYTFPPKPKVAHERQLKICSHSVNNKHISKLKFAVLTDLRTRI